MEPSILPPRERQARSDCRPPHCGASACAQSHRKPPQAAKLASDEKCTQRGCVLPSVTFWGDLGFFPRHAESPLLHPPELPEGEGSRQWMRYRDTPSRAPTTQLFLQTVGQPVWRRWFKHRLLVFWQQYNASQSLSMSPDQAAEVKQWRDSPPIGSHCHMPGCMPVCHGDTRELTSQLLGTKHPYTPHFIFRNPSEDK